MEARLPLIAVLLAGLAACQVAPPPTAPPTTAPAASADSSKSSYISVQETQRLKDLLPGPFPRRPGASADETKAMDALLSAAEVEVIRGVQADTSVQARARADSLEESDPWWNFDLVMGHHFNSKECPRIDAFMS